MTLEKYPFGKIDRVPTGLRPVGTMWIGLVVRVDHLRQSLEGVWGLDSPLFFSY